MGTQFVDQAGMGWMTNFAKVSSLIFMDNMRCIADLIFGGVCHRFPDLQASCRWSRASGGSPPRSRRSTGSGATVACATSTPSTTCLPSEYFRRQIYGCFWFEQPGRARRDRAVPGQHPVRERLPAPDVPAPRAAHAGQRPRDYAQELLGGLPDEIVRKVLHDNAAAVYKLP